MQHLRDLSQGHRLAMKTLGQQLAFVEVAVGHCHGFGISRREMRHAQLNHFPRTHKQNVDLGEVFKELRRQFHGGGGHADGVRTDLGGASDPFGHGEASLKELIQGRAQRPCVPGRLHGSFDLPQNLWLPKHHRVQATGHSKRVSCSQVVFVAVAMGLKGAFVHPPKRRKPILGLLQITGLQCTVNLGSVASRQNRRLGLSAKLVFEVCQ